MQSTVLDELFNGDENVVVIAPTGTGKTVLFELAILRMVRQSADAKVCHG